jgi:hypothetical protein
VIQESASALTLAEAGGKQTTLLRSDIEQLQSGGGSLMPNGLEQQISPAQMLSLVRFLKTGE